LAEPHRSDAADWFASRKRDFANSMDNLLAVDAGENMSKSADDPAGWMPEVGKCRYAQRWFGVKQHWGLAWAAMRKRHSNPCLRAVLK
jgi:hypothetical protein